MQLVGPARARINLGLDVAVASAVRQLISLHIFLQTEAHAKHESIHLGRHKNFVLEIKGKL